MRLGLKRNEVRLVEHHNSWQEEFKKIKDVLLKQTSLDESQIQHIGSTAIIDIKAKPILDLLVGIPSFDGDLVKLEKELRSADFYRLKVERPNEIVFAKFSDDSFEEKTHYIHLVKIDGELWYDLIFFRDYLNKDAKARKEYEQIKLDFTNEKKEGIEEYTNLKESFVKEILTYREINH